jgi:hypothetical protein
MRWSLYFLGFLFCQRQLQPTFMLQNIHLRSALGSAPIQHLFNQKMLLEHIFLNISSFIQLTIPQIVQKKNLPLVSSLFWIVVIVVSK